MRHSSEYSQTRWKEADVKTALDPEAIEDGVETVESIQNKHRHTDVTGSRVLTTNG